MSSVKTVPKLGISLEKSQLFKLIFMVSQKNLAFYDSKINTHTVLGFYFCYKKDKLTIMKILDSLLFAFAVVFFIIGIHQTFIYGLELSYFFFAFSGVFFLFMVYRRRKRQEAEQNEGNQQKQTAKKGKKK
ncbi:hypothetical protein BC781_106285 [Sediminitomix flava]|uniref:Uncharacterized protein n=2 Tax=Sediminitomix flava TaxID=379075 RepID=A0A315Z6X0_SEDFL|nr:hypothetical protein BC781_106285 [Sediminitomix flava]